MKKDIPESMYQTICIELETTDDCVKGTIVKSVNPIPEIIDINDGSTLHLSPINDFFNTAE